MEYQTLESGITVPAVKPKPKVKSYLEIEQEKRAGVRFAKIIRLRDLDYDLFIIGDEIYVNKQSSVELGVKLVDKWNLVEGKPEGEDWRRRDYEVPC